VPKTSCARKLAPAAKIARKTARETAKPNRNGSAETKLSRLRHPSAMTVGDWQAGLRREFGREQPFLLENIGSEPVFSEFAVTNPGSGGRYRVAIRGAGTGETSAPARTSRPTISAPASTSNSRLHGSAPAVPAGSP
jgi:hypothetical protein